MRKVVSILILFMVVAFLHAEPTVYFTPFDSCFSVDLSGEAYTYDGTETGAWNSEYFGSDLAALMGVAVPEGKDIGCFYNSTSLIWGVKGKTFTIDVSFGDGPDWMYQSISNPQLRIPFGLDIVLRYSTHYETWPNLGNNGVTDKVIHLGYHDSKSNNLNPTTSFTVTPSVYDKIYLWRSFWFDIVLVIPTGVRDALAKNGTISYGNADDYKATVTITVTGEKGTDGNDGQLNKTYTLQLTGYYGDYSHAKSESVLFNVTPTANASSIPISSLVASGDSVKIGDYFYSSSAVQSKDFDADFFAKESYVSPFKIFVSSDSNPTIQGEPFKLHLISVPDTNTSPSVNIPFEIVVDSKYSDGVVFDGTDNTSTSLKHYVTGHYYAENSRYGNENSITYDDEGEILFKFTDAVGENYLTDNGVVGGYYSANVYFHLSTEW